MKTIIYVPLARWDAHYQSTAFFIAQELSKHYKVIYIDNPFTYKDFFLKLNSYQIKTRFISLILRVKTLRKIFIDNENLFYFISPLIFPVNFIRSKATHRSFLNINQKIIDKSISHLLRKEKISDYILFNSFNPFFNLKKVYPQPKLVIYHCVDKIKESKYISRHGPELENEFIKDFRTLTFVTSMQLFKSKSLISERVFYIPNAVDFEFFKNKSVNNIPNDMASILEKKIGYIGNICHRIDYKIIKAISSSFPQYKIVLIGPITDKEVYNEKIDTLDNVELLGAKDYEDVPLYIKSFDCCIIPFKINKLTAGIYPLKINEYLALGKPVVSTSFSEDIIGFKNDIYLCDSVDQFIKSISEAMSEKPNQNYTERIKIAENNSWTYRVKKIRNLISANI